MSYPSLGSGFANTLNLPKVQMGLNSNSDANFNYPT